MSLIVLTANDGTQFQVDIAVASLSKVIVDQMKDAVGDHLAPFPNVDGKSFAKVLEWMNYRHANPAEPEEYDEFIDGNEEKGISKKPKHTPPLEGWDLEFCESMRDNYHADFFTTLLAAHYLEVQGLDKVMCKYIGHMVKNTLKTEADIRTFFNLPNTISDERRKHIEAEFEKIGDEDDNTPGSAFPTTGSSECVSSALATLGDD